MDAKSKAHFINSVATGQTIPCPKCGAANTPDSKFCISCGAEIAPMKKTDLQEKQETKKVPAFAPIQEHVQPVVKEVPDDPEPVSVFADGLPSWDIVPPHVMVRRH